MFLSMIIPVYNTEKYLAECLDSCLAQDFPYDDYEIICVNDGSKDGSLDILRSYEARYPNIIVIDQPNGGVSAARNAGLDAARGDYIWFIDADDFIQESVLAEIKALTAEKSPERLTFRFDNVPELADDRTADIEYKLKVADLVAKMKEAGLDTTQYEQQLKDVR